MAKENRSRIIVLSFVSVTAFAASLLTGCASSSVAGPSGTESVDPAARRCVPDSADVAPAAGGFEGKKLLVLSDADMPASAFLDGKLQAGGREPQGNEDALTTLGLPLHIGKPRDPGPDDQPPAFGQTKVENSVIGPPYGVAVSPDGRLAYVLRTRGNPPAGVTELRNVFTDLPLEAMVSVTDITDVGNPKVIQTISVGRAAHTLSLSPDGSLLAINSDEPGRNIILRQIQSNGHVGNEVLAAEAGDPGQPVRRVGLIQWHPSGRFLSHGIPFQNEIRFHEVVRGGGEVAIRPWGVPVKVGKFPDEGTFTPDGNYFLSTDLQWGDDVPGLFVDPPPGSISAVRFDAVEGRHQVTGNAPTDVSPEGIAVSPDGRHIVTGNLRHSWLPWNDSRLTREGSMNLLELDQESGLLRTVQRVPVDGILPEGVTFDASGGHVAITVFDRFDPRYRRGAVQFFTLSESNGCTGLVRTDVEMEVPSGPHSLFLVR